VKKKELAPKIKWFEVHAPEIADKALPGQFIMVMVDEKGERIPLNLAGYDARQGTICFAFYEVGKTTKQLGCLKEGEAIASITGPLGKPSDIRNFGKVLCVAGGVMIAPMLLQAKALRQAGNRLTVVLGARIKDLLFFEEDFKALSDEVYVTTDDGSKGFKGLDFLKDVLEKERFDRCVTYGPVVMMKNVVALTKPCNVPTVVIVTPIMIDGMGMCGVCRVTVGGKMKFGCVDGPEFDGHSVDFDELVNRQRMFLPEERLSSFVFEIHGGCGCGGK
jgi:ferredoxin/flavodoxin---NADP+ reductase